MTEYKLINPSDPYTFLAKTKESAALAVFLLGTMYGASPKDDNEEKRIPVFLFGGAEEWYQKEFGRKCHYGRRKEKGVHGRMAGWADQHEEYWRICSSARRKIEIRPPQSHWL